MPSKQERFRIAVLDDYQNVALSLADWSVLDARATVTVFNDHLADSDAVVERLQPFDIVCVMRERTPMTRAIIERLPKLRLIASTAGRNASIDLKAAEERGVQVVHTGYTSAPTIELTWALILGGARNLVAENASLRSGGWQQSVGDDMAGRTLGVLGLGNVGGAVARIGAAFGMKVIAWSQNLTTERAAEVGATLVSKDELFQEADVVSIHLVLSGRTRGLVGAAELALMKPTARLVNTSRGPIVVEADLVAALKDKKIAGAAIDVFDQEPLPLDHPFRSLPNLLATPHIGYVSRGLYERFYQDTVANIARWLDGQAERLTRAAALGVTIMAKLQGKVAVVTGGIAGIGFATAKRFVDEGAFVFAMGRHQKKLDEAVKAIGSNVVGVLGDVSNLQDLDRLYETAAIGETDSVGLDELRRSGLVIGLGRGTMDYWDPAVTDGLAKNREVILFNNAGVSSSSGKVPTSFQETGANAIAFIKALGLAKVDVLGFSIGGMVAQEITAEARELVAVGSGRAAPICQRANPQRSSPAPTILQSISGLRFTSRRPLRAGPRASSF